MGTFASTFRQEVARIARREIRVMTDGTKKLAGQHRSEIAKLKRVIQEQDRKIERIKTELAKAPAARSTPRTTGTLPTPKPDGVPEGFRYSVRSLKSQRTRLKLSAADYAKLLGVSMQTVYNWEQGKARPRDSQMAAIVEVRGMGRREALARLEELGGVAPTKARRARRKIAQKARRARSAGAGTASSATTGASKPRKRRKKKASGKTASRKKRGTSRKA